MRQRTSYAHCPPALEVARISAHSAQLTFVENAVQVSAPDGAAAWEADVYTLVVPWQDDLYDMVESRYGDWLAHAKDRAYESAAAEIRERRDALLLSCDWTQAPDVPFVDNEREEWLLYRQALRDVPQQEGFPYAVVWPDKP